MLSSACERWVCEEELVEVAGELALDAADRLAFAFAAGTQAFVVGACFGVAADAGAGDYVQDPVQLPVAAAVEAVAALGAARAFDRTRSGERGEGGLALHASGLAAGDDQLRGGEGAGAAFGDDLGHERGDDRCQL